MKLALPTKVQCSSTSGGLLAGSRDAGTPDGATPTRLRAGLSIVAAAMLAASAASADPLPVQQVAPGVYLFVAPHEEAATGNLGAIGNLGFVVGGDSVAVIDTGGSAAAGERLREAVRTVTDLPVRFVINTHVHPDHIFGNAAFEDDDPDFIGHRNLPRAMAERGGHYLRRLEDELGHTSDGTRLVPPTRTVDATLEIDLGGRVLLMTAHPAAHTDSDLTVLDPMAGVLWTGDLLFVDRIPVVDGSLKGWLKTIGALHETGAAILIPGHGGPVRAAGPALDDQKRYLDALLTEIRVLIANGGSMEQAVETVGHGESGHWKLFESYHPRNVVTAYAELEWE